MPLPIHKDVPLSQLPSQIGVTLAIAAGKGGVGKSTVAVNLAVALQKQGYRVGLIDADIYGPSLSRMLPSDRPPAQKGSFLLPAKCGGIEMISVAHFFKEGEAIAVRGPIAHRLILQLIRKVKWGKLDYLLIDFPPGTGDVQLSICQIARLSGALMVTTPQEVALSDVRRAIAHFRTVNVPVLGIVENMSFFCAGEGIPYSYPFGRGGGEKLANEVGVPFFGSIPLEPRLSSGGDEGRPLVSFDAEVHLLATAGFLQIAERVIAEVGPKESDPPVSLWQFSDGSSKMGGPALHSLGLLEIEQKAGGGMWVKWSDGGEGEFRLADLQRCCPCAACQEKPVAVSDEVRVLSCRTVGRYGLQMEFSSGCSLGIYSAEVLLKVVRGKKCKG